MNRRSLHQDLLHSGKYRQQVVKAKKGKGAFSRHDKHKKHRHDESGGVFFMGVAAVALSHAPKSAAPAGWRRGR
ncbi:alternative ribosome rescue factor ArfA [Cardiobacterium hominis]|uniref:alternative ribosome rescue factor ArfA n=1 Tax=Cardiobacterium hominis TaxID=2718 RepID=UPI0011779EAE